MQIEFNGFDRVLINQEGEAWSFKRAFMADRDMPTVGFRRDDGWTIGAPQWLESTCYDLYKNNWTHFVKMPSLVWQPIQEYRQANGYPDGCKSSASTSPQTPT